MTTYLLLTLMWREHREGREFLQSELLDVDLDANFRHCSRVTSLAEFLYNFQGIPGIKHRVELMKLDVLEAALGELACARLIAAPELRLEFIIPTSTKGAGL